MDQAEWKLLKEIAELEKTPQGAYNIRRNGALDSRNSTANIEITTKTEPGKSGIDIRIKPGTRHESVHIPVIISQTGLSEMVYNDFFIGEDCDVDIVAGCGIHNTGCETSQHDGVHTFYVGKNSKVRYVERHYGEGPGTGKRIMNPQTVVYLEEGATINLDDISHIDFLRNTIGYTPKKISCRYNPGGVFQVGESEEGFQVMDNPGEAKYGMTRPQIAQAFRRLKELGAEEFGIHAFLASNTLSNEYYPALARVLFQLAAELKEETGCHITFINLSGGVGVPYRPEQPANDIAAIGAGVRKAYEEILVPAGMGDVSLCTELGRFMLAPYGHLVTRVLHQKHTYKEYVGVDACASNLMRPAIYGAYHHITVMGKEDVPCDHKYDVTGSLCENSDKFAIDRMLPEVEIGDLLVIHDTGAHGHAMGYQYNGRLRSAEVLLQEDGSA